ncbi:DUF420 domain-containing protein [bacterium]|nr:DUF420 domain-containing protein [bacterium]
MNINELPTLNAILNSISAILLLLGYFLIKKKNRSAHKKVMIAALMTSGMFLTSYLIYHFEAGSVPYPHYDWTRVIYFAILIPHVILAMIMTPFIVIAVWHAFHDHYDKHRKLVHWVWPVWMFVSASGVVVYWMLYRM